MTIDEHLRKEAAGELGTLLHIIDMIDRGVDAQTMKATLERRVDELERHLKLTMKEEV